jgi:hypothetical protein
VSAKKKPRYGYHSDYKDLAIGDFVRSTTGDFEGVIERTEYDPRGPYFFVRRTWDRYTPAQRGVLGIDTNVGQIIGILGSGLRRVRHTHHRSTR